MRTLSGLAPPRAAAAVLAHAAGGALMRWWAAYTTWRIERLAIARLRAMSDRQLKDMGIVRAEIEFAVKGKDHRDGAAGRSFWWP